MPLLLSTVEIDLLQLTVESLLAGAIGDEPRWAHDVVTTLCRLVGGDCGLLALGTGAQTRLYGERAERAEARALVARAVPPVTDDVASAAVSGTHGWMADGVCGRGRQPAVSLWLHDAEHGVHARFVASLPASSGDAVLKRARSVLEIVRPAFSAAVRVHQSSMAAPDAAQPGQRALSVAASLRDRYALTARETDVTALLLQGRANTQIARALAISESTARHHTERVLDKLGVRSRAEVPGLALGQMGTPPFGMTSVALPAGPASGKGGGSRAARRHGAV